jgi:type VI secretion system protein ImpC
VPSKFSFGRVELTTQGEPAPAPVEIGEETPFRIGVLGNFRGRRDRERPEGSTRPTIRVDHDDLDGAMATLDVDLGLTLDGQGPGAKTADLAFRSMEGFHPDRLLEAEVFRPLREARRRLADPATFREAAKELGLLPAAGASPAPAVPAASPGPGDVLEQVLRQTAEAGPRGGAGDVEAAVNAIVDRIVGPYSQRSDPKQAELVAHVEAAMAGLLRGVLHHPDFRALEAAWRGVHLLTRRLDTGSTLTIDLIDAGRGELDDDLVSRTPLEETATCRRLVAAAGGDAADRPWALLVADFNFEPNPRDVALLWRLGQVARRVGAPLVAAASPRFVGCHAAEHLTHPEDWGTAPEVQAWAALRRDGVATYLGLAIPRVILRAPYGPDGGEVEALRFAEFPEVPPHDAYLWGNPAFAVALVLGRAFVAAGWSWAQSVDPEVGGLPVILERHGRDVEARPCGEVEAGQRAVERLLAAGLLPVASVRGRDAVRLAQFRSIADPPALLAVPGV